MIDKIIEFSLRQRAFVMLVAVVWVGMGLWSGAKLPIDAVPDITNIQVQINTSAGAYAAEEVEKLITFPIENEMSGIPRSELVRSISRYGFSQVTVIFEEGTDIYRARQLVSERMQNVLNELPPGTEPQMAPITTGLGDIFFYTLSYAENAPVKPESSYEQLVELKLVQDYLIKPLLRSVPGVAEVNTSGGYDKEIIIRPDVVKLRSVGLSVGDLADKIAENTENTGGGLLEIGGEQVSIRTNGRVAEMEQISNLPVLFQTGAEPLLVKDLAVVEIGSAIRTGASTENGEEALLGGALMLTDENSRIVSNNVAEQLEKIQSKLPEGIVIRTVYDRSDVVGATIGTVRNNLLEGAVLVMAVLFFMLGNIRAAILVALAIPLSMLFALIGMRIGGVSGNLMSLGAIDFGLIVEGSVVMVENAVRRLGLRREQLGRALNPEEKNKEVLQACKEMGKPMFFGVLIITIVYVPILALTGIEGKMFKPMALTVMFALIGSLLLALTLVPVLCSFFLKPQQEKADTRLNRMLRQAYAPVLEFTLQHRWIVLGGAASLFVLSLLLFSRLGAEFVPKLDEGSLSIQMIRSNSTGIGASLDMQMRSEKLLLKKFPEISHTFSRIGTAEVATDPMGTNVADTYVMLKPEAEWRKIDGRRVNKTQLIELMREELITNVPGQNYLFTQPIELRFNEILAGTRADLSVKVFGDDYETLERLADEIRDILVTIPGAGDVEFETSGRNPVLEINPKRDQLRRYNLHVADINRVVESALAGSEVGTMVEGNRRYPIVVRAPEGVRHDLERIRQLPLRTDEGGLLQLGQVADLEVIDAIGTIGRESIQRRLAVLVNMRGGDTESFVKQAEAKIGQNIQFPDGYYYEFGGQYENLVQARQRLAIVVPVALGLIFMLIFLAFGSVRQALIIITGVPLAVTGGVMALWLRDMPFSISAGIGFIALSGIATLDGIVLVTVFNELREQGRSLMEAVREGAMSRLRPVMMTSLVASLGFVPMALATSAGAEVQRPLATVVVGGVLSEVFLTLVVVPVLYLWLEQRKKQTGKLEN
ncbi:MAG: CusA/CzcA family heavy metal efflux RND transporter [Verrucomicrobiota bacterium]